MSLLPQNLNYRSHFGSTAQTISNHERKQGIGSVFPIVLTGDKLPSLGGNDSRKYTIIPLDETLVVKGQGLVALKIIPGKGLNIILSKDKLGPNPPPQTTVLKLELTDDSALLRSSLDTQTIANIIPSTASKGLPAAFVVPGIEDTYWLSVDQENGYIRYGKGYRSANLTYLLSNHLDIGDKVTKLGPYAWIKDLVHIQIESLQADAPTQPQLIQLSVGALPIVRDLSPVIADPAKLTLEEIETGSVTSIANLSRECQMLYGNVGGQNIILDEGDFKEFSKAILWSIQTPGKICYKRLEEKAKEFGNDPTMTYLRITLGLDEGDSPGVPYVVEIWPPGHKSPIHDHGHAYAVIKLLHGSINCSYFSRLDAPRYKFEPDVHLVAGQLTWISPDNYQVHQLHNDGEDVCVTIQCYRYADTDRVHDEYFDYIPAGTQPQKKPFKPDSDFAFMQFKRDIKAEWEGRNLQST